MNPVALSDMKVAMLPYHPTPEQTPTTSQTAHPIPSGRHWQLLATAVSANMCKPLLTKNN